MKASRIPISMVLLVCLLLAGCNLPAAAPVLPEKSFSGGLQVWVDAPLEGTTLPLDAAASVVCHGTDPDGISRLEFSVDGSPQSTQENPSAEEKLFMAGFTWQPASAGQYTLGCRAQNGRGDWSGWSVVHVTVRGAGTVTQVQPETLSPTFTPTLIPTSTPTPTSTLVPAGFTFDHSISTAAFQYRRDCLPNPNAVTISVSISPASGEADVYLFYHLQNQATGEKSPWHNGGEMNKDASGAYSRTVTSAEIPDLEVIYNGGNSGIFLYQIIVMDSAGAVIARSPVYADVTLSPCR